MYLNYPWKGSSEEIHETVDNLSISNWFRVISLYALVKEQVEKIVRLIVKAIRVIEI